ncbi:MAG: DMT family transporter [Candidatus Marinimicrobia bacterium]|nr:DMT family transporter [Candidatus Neomarinimicrobiota bacterium]
MLSNTIGWRTAVFTSLALVAFAANSLFNRAAFAASGIDAGSFAVIRLASGALALALISWTRGALRASLRGGSWQAGAMLFAYAAAFSYAYISLSVGTGALILFAAVQITMLLAALRLGEKVTARQWAGLALAFAGLGVLLFPGLTAPSPGPAALMATAGVAWGIYSLLGRQSASPLSDTAANFMRSLPFAAVLGLAIAGRSHITTPGVTYALLSGVVASGLGYSIWYMALRGLSAAQAAIVQLLVPVLASIAGVLFLREAVTGRLSLSTAMILGGVALAIATHKGRSSRTNLDGSPGPP